MVSTQGTGPLLWPLFFLESITQIRTYIYVDGFNLYYGAVKNTPYKWLNLKALFRYLLKPQHDIRAIKYFTALVSGKIDPDQLLRQKAFLRAIQKYIEDPMAEVIIQADIKEGDTISVGLDKKKEELTFKILKTSQKQEKEQTK